MDDESSLIASIGAALASIGRPVDLTDDCAHLEGRTDLVTTDALVEGVHFGATESPREVGVQAAVANLSDIAACGAEAVWLLWALCLPSRWTARITELTLGFAETADRYGTSLVGGNLSSTAGPAVISVTAGGRLVGKKPLRRDGAGPGDTLYVSGVLGDAALGLLRPDPETHAARHAWRPHLAEAKALALCGRATAAMDISDGLVLDARRMAAASGVRLAIDSSCLPTSALYRRRLGDDLRLALEGGEDYVLLFSATGGGQLPFEAWAIGQVEPGEGITVDGAEYVGRGGHVHWAHPCTGGPWT